MIQSQTGNAEQQERPKVHLTPEPEVECERSWDDVSK